MKDMTKKNIAVFDLDGTLVETDAANNAAYRVVLERVGRLGVSGLYGRISAKVVRSTMGLSDGEMSEVVRKKVDDYCYAPRPEVNARSGSKRLRLSFLPTC